MGSGTVGVGEGWVRVPERRQLAKVDRELAEGVAILPAQRLQQPGVGGVSVVHLVTAGGVERRRPGGRRASAASGVFTMEIAVPPCPARAVRPTRCW